MRPDATLRGERSRALHRRLVRDRGPDAGRDVDHLKHRSRDGAAEALVDAYERAAIPAAQTAELSVRSGTGGFSLFMTSLSTVGGSDPVG